MHDQATGKLTPAGKYWGNRANDAMDMCNLGITFSPQVEFGLYMDFFNITPIGGSCIDGYYFGLADRQFGKLTLHDQTWGILFWGQIERQIGKLNPNDPHQAWHADMLEKRQIQDKTEVEKKGKGQATDPAKLLEENMNWKSPRYNTGLIQMINHGNPPPPTSFIRCRRWVHLAWIGVSSQNSPLDILDFVLGFTTLDIIGDDIVGRPDLRSPTYFEDERQAEVEKAKREEGRDKPKADASSEAVPAPDAVPAPEEAAK